MAKKPRKTAEAKSRKNHHKTLRQMSLWYQDRHGNWKHKLHVDPH